MATSFPANIDVLVNPQPTDSVEAVSHASQHINANDSIEALEIKVGKDNDTNVNSLDYKVRTLEANILDTEEVEDLVGGLLTNGIHNNIVVVYDDVTRKINLSATYDNEETITAIANALTAGTGITKTYTGNPPNYRGDYNNGISYALNDIVSIPSGSPYGNAGEYYIRTGNPGNPGYPPGAPGNWTLYSFSKAITIAVDTSSIATQSYVNAAVAELVNSAPAVLNTLNEIAAALGNDSNFSSTIANALSLKAPLSSPVFTGLPTAPTQSPDDNSTTIATTAFVQTAKTSANQTSKSYTDAAISALGNTSDTKYVPVSEVGQADGIAQLDGSGKVPLTQLDIDEKIQDVAAGLITSGTHTNLTATYDDVTGKINFTAVAQLTQEQVQDAIGPLFAHGTNPNISVTYDDEANRMILEAYIPPSTAKMSPTAPTSPIDGQFWFDTDEYRSGNTRSLKVWNALSSTWEYVATDLSLSTTNTWTSKNTFTNGIIIGLSSAPLTPVHGQIYYNTILDKLKVWDGLLWQDIQGSGGGGGLTLVPTDTSVPASTFFVGLIAPPIGATSAGDLWIDVDDDAGSTEFVFAGPNPPAEGTYGMDTLWIDTDEPELPLIYSDEEPPTYTAIEGDFWVDLDDTSGQSILSSTTPPNPAQTEFWLDLTTEEGEITYSDLFKNNAAQITNFASLPAASLHGGMIAYISSEASLYVAAAGQWIKIFPTFDAETLIWAGV